MTPVSPCLAIHSVLVAKKANKSLSIPVKLATDDPNSLPKVELALADTGAGGKFIDQNYAKSEKYPLSKLKKPIPVNNVDGTPNKKGMIKYYTTLNMVVNGRKTREHLFATGLGKQKIILGFPWFEQNNPLID